METSGGDDTLDSAITLTLQAPEIAVLYKFMSRDSGVFRIRGGGALGAFSRSF